MAHGAHDFRIDPRNASVLVNVNGELIPRDRAVVSVFDAGFVLGDGVWEGLRVSGGHPAFLEAHLDRLYEGAAALLIDVGRSRAELTAEIYRTLRANGMTDGVHVRLMVTRGVKSTPYQDPRLTVGPATVVIVAEHKDPLPATLSEGLSLRWPAGPRDTDGVWAPHWYAAVWASTGFAPRPREVALGAREAAVAEACRPAYEALRERRLRV